MKTPTTDPTTAARLRELLLEMARDHDVIACNENAAAAYWEPTPFAVISHRAAAHALRARADLISTAR